jgi:hypothetical protein
MLLGASIGFADGVTGLYAWQMLGQPDFFIRRNHGEIPTIALMTFSGTLAGILYGGFLIRMSHQRTQGPRLGRIYCSSVVAAIPIFFCTHYYIVAHRVPLTKVSFIPEVAVFLLSIALAVYIDNKKEPAPPKLQ